MNIAKKLQHTKMSPLSAKSAFCADDWGLSPGINLGILELAKKNWLNSVSLIATAPYLTHRLDELLNYSKNGLKLSAHLNLTYGSPLSTGDSVASLIDPATGQFFSLKRLLLNCISGKIHRADLKTELQLQLDGLKQLGVKIDSVNGHHHVHLLPGVYPVLKELLQYNKIQKLRIMVDPDHPMSFLQSHCFKRFLWDHGDGFQLEECRYLVRKNLRDQKSFQRKLTLPGGPLLVHPALFDDFAETAMSDNLQADRITEFESIVRYLS